MRALYFHNQLEYVPDYPAPEPLPGEALIRVFLAGVCNTDLEMVKGYMNFQGVLGHEFVGVVERAEDPAWVGRRIVGEINAGCRICEYCRSGMARHCPDRSVLGILNRGGAFADYLTLPIANLHPVPSGVSNEEAVFTEPIAAACEILEQSEFEPGEAIVVLGDGKLGLLIAQVLHAEGLRVTLIGKHLERAEAMLDPGIRLIPAGESLDRRFAFVVEATGNPEAFVQALDLLKPRGSLFLKSTTARSPEFPMARLVIDEISVIGSRCGPFEPALQLLCEGRVKTGGMIDAVFPLEKGVEAMQKAAQRGVCKVLFEVNRT